jgi:hypothetical protein
MCRSARRCGRILHSGAPPRVPCLPAHRSGARRARPRPRTPRRACRAGRGRSRRRRRRCSSRSHHQTAGPEPATSAWRTQGMPSKAAWMPFRSREKNPAVQAGRSGRAPPRAFPGMLGAGDRDLAERQNQASRADAAATSTGRTAAWRRGSAGVIRLRASGLSHMGQLQHFQTEVGRIRCPPDAPPSAPGCGRSCPGRC